VSQPTESDAAVPREPFPYQAIREPVIMTIFFAALAAAGLVMLVPVKKHIDAGDHGWVGVAIMLLVCFCGLGLAGVYMGIKRWIWKRQYIRATGRSPFA
jgi:hypothetical protein